MLENLDGAIRNLIFLSQNLETGNVPGEIYDASDGRRITFGQIFRFIVVRFGPDGRIQRTSLRLEKKRQQFSRSMTRLATCPLTQ
uniref:Uncharacterized protein n=1 Tax=Romanomermis culicivorax TaxID=13658 RepID=A0A915L751_ROMCU